MTTRARRAICLGIVATALGAAGTAAAQSSARGAFDGTWGGAEGDLTAQVIVVGVDVIGFYWRGDYTDARDVKVSADGRSLSFAFGGGHATLTLGVERAATLVVTEGATVTRLNLKRD